MDQRAGWNTRPLATPVGDPALAYKGELLFDHATRIAVRGERQEAGILVLDCEVMA